MMPEKLTITGSGSEFRSDQGVVNTLMRHADRWETTPEIRRKALAWVEGVLDDHEASDYSKDRAVGHLLKMEQMNQVDQKVTVVEDGGQKVDVIYLLPPNGTEKRIEMGEESRREVGEEELGT
jgi:hypothetical protein